MLVLLSEILSDPRRVPYLVFGPLDLAWARALGLEWKLQ